MNGEPKKSIWQSPWTWTIGGCCLGCLGIPLLFVTVLGTGVLWTFRSAGFSDVKDEALARARQSSVVAEALGEPIKAGFPRNTSVDIHNSEGRIRLTLPLSGPKGKGRLQIAARTHGKDEIEFERLVFEGEDGYETDLLTGQHASERSLDDGADDDTADDDTADDDTEGAAAPDDAAPPGPEV